MTPTHEQLAWAREALECGEHVGYDTCIIHGGQGWPCAEAVALAEKVAARDQQVKAGAIDALADKWQWGGWSDPNVRQAIIDLFPPTGGGKCAQIGTKGQPGPLYGVSSHAWPALGVALTAQARRPA